YDDWFLPSKDELTQMFINLEKNNLGEFAFDGYWSSSEASRVYAWRQYFSESYQRDSYKNYEQYVRAIRAF
ncbi:MAG TPA: hypothetical protein PK771_10415, partial [Spirochaetota bacterium]|nr:hypothetical protein [Spirochaetota bacterium]